jgi:HEPN domain-containing protein
MIKYHKSKEAIAESDKAMDAQEKYEYWLDIAQYDLETADAMFDSGRWLYSVSFEKFALFEDLRLFYVNGRYTDFKQKLSESTDKATAADFLNQTKEVFAWLLTQKP